ncbi:hypothetical protein [Actinosynnema sp. NPDC020468]|uniref:WXG100 family type VII secretion target n=1 Tax=Actinosynnema sp. NPDC020468 TaxID=3154488 RepID=UPI0033EF2494
MSGFQSDLNRLTQGAGDFDAFAGRAGRITTELSTSLDALGECWGDDAVGRSFAAGHVKPAADALGGLDAVHRGFGGVSRRFAETERTYRGVEEGNTTAFGQI